LTKVTTDLMDANEEITKVREERGRLRVQVEALKEERDKLQAQIHVQNKTLDELRLSSAAYREAVEAECRTRQDRDRQTIGKLKKRLENTVTGYTLAWVCNLRRDDRAKGTYSWLMNLVSDGIDAYGKNHKEAIEGLVWDEMMMSILDTQISFDPKAALLNGNILCAACIPNDLDRTKLLELLSMAKIAPSQMVFYVPAISQAWHRLDGAREVNALVDALVCVDNVVREYTERHAKYHEKTIKLLERGIVDSGGDAGVPSIGTAPADAP